MKAIILAAGKATRLLPLTKETPQCLLKIGTKTILEKQIDLIKGAGIKDVLVVTGHLSEQVEKFCKIRKIKTLFNPFYNISNIALTLWIVKESLQSAFILLYSDILFDSIILKELLKSEEDMCLAIKKNGVRAEAEKVIELNGLIQHMRKNDIGYENGGDGNQCIR